MTTQKELYEKAKSQANTTREHITGLVRKLSPDQLSFRAEPNAWSVGEVLEHLIVSDELFDRPVREALAKYRPDAAAPLRNWKPTLLGGFVAKSLTSTKKYKTPKAFQPGPSPRAGVLEAFRSMDMEVLRLMDQAAQHDWRAIKVRSPALPRIVPAYNLGDVFNIHALHTARHAAQIERVIGKMTG